MTNNRPKGKPVEAEEVIHFTDPSDRIREKILKQKAARRPSSSKNAMEDSRGAKGVKPLRKSDYHDLLRFGISELKGEERSKARLRLAVELGAKPPKKSIKNYKEFLGQQKKDKEAKQKVLDERQIIQEAIKKGKPKGKFDKKRRNKRGKNDVARKFDGQIGTYKRGVQFISKRDIAADGSKSKRSKI